jgi:Mg2+-importing ATPase
VLRDGVTREVPAREVVPGDVLLLAAGDLVAADAALIEARDLFVNQALLTGEPYPVEKRPTDAEPRARADGSATPADSVDTVYMGTSVVSGSGRAVVITTGAQTAVGQIGLALVRRPPPRAFELGTRSFGPLILRLTMLMVLFVMTVQLLRGARLLESLLFAVALAVGLTPELLPMVVSVTLARWALRISRARVLVKRLTSIHDLGSMDVFCTDKTGTLTEAEIRLERHLDPLGRDSDRVLELLFLNSAFENSAFESGLRSPLDDAILRHMEVDIRGWSKLDELPFDFERRRVSVLAEHAGERLLIVKGAFEDVLRLSVSYERDGPTDVRPIDDDVRRQLMDRFEALAGQGFRVLGVAYRPWGEHAPRVGLGDETELVFGGFGAFEDPPKPDAGAALRALSELGVTVKIVTGDNATR